MAITTQCQSQTSVKETQKQRQDDTRLPPAPPHKHSKNKQIGGSSRHFRMNVKVVLVVVVLLLLVLLSTVLGMPQYFGKKRKFPGQRLRGATNYGTHSFGMNGYDSKPIARAERELRKYKHGKLALLDGRLLCSLDGDLCFPPP